MFQDESSRFSKPHRSQCDAISFTLFRVGERDRFPTPREVFIISILGTWRSPVAHCNGVAGVAGSNPAVPIWARSRESGSGRLNRAQVGY